MANSKLQITTWLMVSIVDGGEEDDRNCNRTQKPSWDSLSLVIEVERAKWILFRWICLDKSFEHCNVGKYKLLSFKVYICNDGFAVLLCLESTCFRSVLVTLFPGVITFLDVASVSHSRHINVFVLVVVVFVDFSMLILDTGRLITSSLLSYWQASKEPLLKSFCFLEFFYFRI